MAIQLGGLDIEVGPPAIPSFQVAPPSTTGGVVVPVAGAPGPPGQQGEPGPAGPPGPVGDASDLPTLSLIFENGLI